MIMTLPNVVTHVQILQLMAEDRETLLEDSWKDLFILTMAQWSFPIEKGESIYDFKFQGQPITQSIPTYSQNDVCIRIFDLCFQFTWCLSSTFQRA